MLVAYVATLLLIRVFLYYQFLIVYNKGGVYLRTAWSVRMAVQLPDES